MIRSLLTEIAIFLIPFIGYGLFLLAMRANIRDRDAWPMHVVSWLALAGAVLVIGSLVLLTQFSGAPPGSTYEPAHVEDGRLVPGGIR